MDNFACIGDDWFSDIEDKMIKLDSYNNKHVGVVGFGMTGKSIVDALIKSEAQVTIFDDSEVSDEKYTKYCADFENFNFKNLDLLVVSPGIHLFWPTPHKTVHMANLNNVCVRNDLDIFQQHTNGKKICVTGTNGKSTTTALIGHVFDSCGQNACIGGNFGIPLMSLENNRDFYIIELSSYTLESCTILGFDTAILLNLAEDHLHRHGGMAGYIAAKQKIFANFNERSNAIISVDDKYCHEIFEFLADIKHPNVIPISGKEVPKGGVGWNKNDQLIDNRFDKATVVCEKNERLDGPHNRQNIAAAYVACVLNGIDREEFSKVLKSFRGLEHRQELVATIKGVQYINDSKATNAQSVEQALIRYSNMHLILGGRMKENGINGLEKYFHKVKRVFLIGEAAGEFQKFLKKYGVWCKISGTLERALEDSRQSLVRDDDVKTVLFSPACSSFDQFKNFEERGRFFKNLVKKIEEKSA